MIAAAVAKIDMLRGDSAGSGKGSQAEALDMVVPLKLNRSDKAIASRDLNANDLR